jgi:hypothetical protein
MSQNEYCESVCISIVNLSSTVIDKNEDGSDITQDVDALVWWRDVGQAQFPRISVMARQFLAIPATSGRKPA